MGEPLDHVADTLLPGLSQCWDQGLFQDLTVAGWPRNADSSSLQCSRLLMAAASSLLKEALADNTDIDAVIVEGVEDAALKAFLAALVGSSDPEDRAQTQGLCRLFGIDLDYRAPGPPPPVKRPRLEASRKGPVHECDTCGKEYLNELSFTKHVKAHEAKKALEKKADNEERPPSGRPKRRLNRPKRFDDTVTTDDDDDDGEGEESEQKADSADDSESGVVANRPVVRAYRRLGASAKSRFVCGECSRGFSSKQALQNHERLHANERAFSCSQCAKSFVTASALSSHERIHEGTGRAFACSHCDKAFNNRSNLERHVRAKHFEFSDGKKFPCGECHKVFVDPSGLSNHVKIHGAEREHECGFCKKRFLTSAQLRVHLVRTN